MVDFSSVNLRITSSDGKTVLAELQTIDKVGQRAAGNATAIGGNMRKSVTAARQLSFAATGITQGLGGAVNAAGNLAEQIALSSRNAKVAAGAAGIGALVAVGATLAAIWKSATEQMETFNDQVNKIGGATEILRLQGRGPRSDLEAKRQAILIAGREELAAADKLKINDEERLQLRTMIAKKTNEAVDALERETALRRSQAFKAGSLSAQDEIEMLATQRLAATRDPAGAAFLLGGKQAEIKRRQALRELDQEASERQFTAQQVKERREQIQEIYQQEMDILGDELAQMGSEVADTFVGSLAGSIADGIAVAIQSGSIGDGFKAMTGGILIGLGEMVQAIGVKSLLAAKLMTTIFESLRNFAPAGAIGPALALIALGGVLKGLGASMGGGGGGGGGLGASGFSGGGSFGGGNTIIDRGLVNPLNGVVTAPGTISARQSITVPITVIGAMDASAQRQIVKMVRLGLEREGGTI